MSRTQKNYWSPSPFSLLSVLVFDSFVVLLSCFVFSSFFPSPLFSLFLLFLSPLSSHLPPLTFPSFLFPLPSPSLSLSPPSPLPFLTSFSFPPLFFPFFLSSRESIPKNQKTKTKTNQNQKPKILRFFSKYVIYLSYIRSIPNWWIFEFWIIFRMELKLFHCIFIRALFELCCGLNKVGWFFDCLFVENIREWGW